MRLVIISAFAALLASGAHADPVSGYVNADGSLMKLSSQYTVIHSGLGHYRIEFATPMTPRASCVITPVGKQVPDTPYLWRLSETRTECVVAFLQSGTGTMMDTAFSFIAVPMSN